MSTSAQLQQAFRLIKDGSKAQATSILIPIVRAEPNNADAWWLLANAVNNPDQQRRALEQVLRLRPNDDKARRMLDQIGGFASPPPPPQQFPAQQQDPFAGTPYIPPQQQYDPFAGSAPQGDPFAHVGSGQPQTPPVVIRERRGTNPLVIFLAVIGIVVVIGCGACLLLSGGTLAGVTAIFNQVAGTLTADPDFQNLVGTLSNATPNASNLGSELTGQFNDRGTVEVGQTVNGTVDTFEDDGWTFSVNSGQRLTIDVHSRDEDLDPQLYLYDPGNSLIGENDDVDFASSNRDSHLEIALPSSGTYTIIVSAFGQGGDYELSLK
jgi:hypothetical protein